MLIFYYLTPIHLECILVAWTKEQFGNMQKELYIYFLTHFREMWIREYKCTTFKEIVHNTRLPKMFIAVLFIIATV